MKNWQWMALGLAAEGAYRQIFFADKRGIDFSTTASRGQRPCLWSLRHRFEQEQ